MIRTIVALAAFSFMATQWRDAAGQWNILQGVLVKAEAVIR